MINELIVLEEDIKVMLDNVLKPKTDEWWNHFYDDKDKTIPFFKNLPSENIIQYRTEGKIRGGKALDIGCGNGRNSYFLANNGYKVIGLDFSSESISWANEMNPHKNIEYINASFFDYEAQLDHFDFIYDGGCLHHIPPHRRPEYLKKIQSLLKGSGKYGFEIFNEKGGSALSDYDVYREQSMKGGIAFSEEHIRKIMEPYFTILELREMIKIKNGLSYGEDILWTSLLEVIK